MFGVCLFIEDGCVCVRIFPLHSAKISLSSNQVEMSFLGFKKERKRKGAGKRKQNFKTEVDFSPRVLIFFLCYFNPICSDGHGIISYRDQPAVSPGRWKLPLYWYKPTPVLPDSNVLSLKKLTRKRKCGMCLSFSASTVSHSLWNLVFGVHSWVGSSSSSLLLLLVLFL